MKNSDTRLQSNGQRMALCRILLTNPAGEIIMSIDKIKKGNEKEEYANTIPREDGSPAARSSEYGLWKVAFEPESQESHFMNPAKR